MLPYVRDGMVSPFSGDNMLLCGIRTGILDQVWKFIIDVTVSRLSVGKGVYISAR